MLRFLLLCLIFATSDADYEDYSPMYEQTEGSGGIIEEDDEELPGPVSYKYDTGTWSESSNGSKQTQEGSSMIIIIAAVSVVALAIAAVVAIFLFKRHLQSREQGIYDVPVEQKVVV
ncbi:uncharacterized protein si:dkey-262k9.2 [Electrophorus electricus]|uniref:uncharacterized protein si:dkey-262k9.2 n=1 Tax=Electrophorus electricus TaxID=8005 RepID=UPI0015CFB886|nr:uncharacterized protein si:dkey-262k9.2 [Electrophorus electricus]